MLDTEYNEADGANHLYWLDDGHYGFVEYNHTSYDDWVLKIKNGELYKLDTALRDSSASLIKNADLLINLKEKSNFISTAETNNEIPIITGIVFIDNDTAINEKDIERNLVSAYPELKFFFKNVEKTPAAKYVVLNDDGTYDLLARRSLSASEEFFPNPTSLVSSVELDKYDTRSSYDFYGWSDKPLSPEAVAELPANWYEQSAGNLIVTTDNPNSVALLPEQQYDNWSSLAKEDGKIDYIFYAVFGIHKYRMTYYDGDGSILETVLVPAGASIVQNPPKKMVYKEIENTPENLFNIYKHIG